MKKLLLCLICCLLPWIAQAADTFPPASTPLISGIDVSVYQGEIDWAQVGASGKRLAYIRATEGDAYEDPTFRRNFFGARENGLAVGVYHYLTARDAAQARAQARFFIDTLRAAGAVPDCRPAMDLEGDNSFTREQWNQVAAAFLEEVAAYGGYAPCIYSDASGARDRYDDALAVYPLWVANYGVALPEANGRWKSWVGFQFADNGRVAGISGDVDLDYFTQEIFLPSPEPTATPRPTLSPTATPVPTFMPTVKPTPAPTPKPESAYYAAQYGDTMSAIAARYGVEEAALREINVLPLSGQPLAGQLLRIPLSEAGEGEWGGLFISPNASRPYYTARHFAVSIVRLDRLNFFPVPGRVLRGQVMRIPVRSAVSTVSADALLGDALVVQPGDSLSTVAQAMGIRPETLAAWNGLAAEDALPPGLLLRLGPASAAHPARGYVVRRGDHLSRLARRFQTTMDALVALNDLPNRNLLVIGQVLLLP